MLYADYVNVVKDGPQPLEDIAAYKLLLQKAIRYLLNVLDSNDGDLSAVYQKIADTSCCSVPRT